MEVVKTSSSRGRGEPNDTPSSSAFYLSDLDNISAKDDGFTVGSDQFPILDHSHDHGGQGLPSSSMSQTDFSLLNDDLFTRRLIEAVRCQPCLYDSSHEHYGNRHTSAQYRGEVWSSICRELNFNGEPHVLQSCWKRIRDRYVRERRKRRVSGAPDPLPYFHVVLSDANAQMSAAVRHFGAMKWIDLYLDTKIDNLVDPSSAYRGNAVSGSYLIRHPLAESGDDMMQEEMLSGDDSPPKLTANYSHTTHTTLQNKSNYEVEGGSLLQHQTEPTMLATNSGQRIFYKVIEPVHQQIGPQQISLLKPSQLGGRVRKRAAPCSDFVLELGQSGSNPLLEEQGIPSTSRELSSNSTHLSSGQAVNNGNNTRQFLQQRLSTTREIRPKPPSFALRGNNNRNVQPSSHASVLLPSQHYILANSSSTSHQQQSIYDLDSALVETIVKHLAALNDDEKVVTKMQVQQLVCDAYAMEYCRNQQQSMDRSSPAPGTGFGFSYPTSSRMQ